MPRPDGRAPDALRPVSFERDFTEMAAGSCLVSFGKTRVLCTASIDEDVPRWMRGRGKGWVTAEYSMLPGSSPERVDREAAKGKQSGRTVEIQRLIARALRAACDMTRARRAAGRRRLRRPAGRRRHAHGQHLRRLPRPPRRAVAARDAGQVGGPPAALVLRRDQRRHRGRHAGARPALRRGQHGRGRHERRHAAPRGRRRGPLRRGPGHGGGDGVHARRARPAARARRGRAHRARRTCRPMRSRSRRRGADGRPAAPRLRVGEPAQGGRDRRPPR